MRKVCFGAARLGMAGLAGNGSFGSGTAVFGKLSCGRAGEFRYGESR